jgi:hypothetical protein
MQMQYVEVVYLDGTSSSVSKDVLDVLVATGRILRFKRAEGWVDIVRDQARLRDYRTEKGYRGEERRAPWPDK